jgi:crotonobetainyl-CoA:carnitine CoA-transferase CaiB-like acyl-CoA transferase
VTGALHGVRVIELTWGIAGPMTGMLLADQGAIVTRLEPPHDPFADQPGYRVWNRGKRSAVIDLREPSGYKAFRSLAAQADVVLDSFRPGVTKRLRIDHDTLAAVNPRLITCSLTAYGEDTEHRNRPGYEALVAARTGSHWAQHGGILSNGRLRVPAVAAPDGSDQSIEADRPIFSASPWMSINGFYHATFAITAALVARERLGIGQHLTTSMLPRLLFTPVGKRDEGPLGQTWMNLIGAPRGLFECKDGRWVHHWPLEPTVIIRAAEDFLDDSTVADYRQRRFDPERIGIEPENIVVLFHYLPMMQAAFKRFPAEEWLRWGERTRVGIQLVRSPEEALSDPDLLADGSVVQLRDPEFGPIRHLGSVIDLGLTPSTVQKPAPRRGEHTGEVFEEARARAPRVDPLTDAPKAAGPLEGVRVLDIGVALAGPYGSSLLADLGADVIKIMAPWDGPWMATGMGQLANYGKRGVLLNLAEPQSLDAFYRLVRTADVVMHNLRSHVVEGLGVGYSQLRTHNPRIIYCALRGFDRQRSARNLPGTDQCAAALSGQEWEDGSCSHGGKPLFGTSMGDLGGGFLAAIGVLLAYYHRQRTGRGQEVGCSILNACLATSSGVFTCLDGLAPERPELDALQLGFNALYGLYRTSSGWICLVTVSQEQWQRLCEAIGRSELLSDARFVDAETRRSNDAELRRLLEEAFIARPATEWLALLDGAGVPAEISALGFETTAADQPFINFSLTPARVPERAPDVGEHSDEVLSELHLAPEVVAAIRSECDIARPRGPGRACVHRDQLSEAPLR